MTLDPSTTTVATSPTPSASVAPTPVRQASTASHSETDSPRAIRLVTRNTPAVDKARRGASAIASGVRMTRATITSAVADHMTLAGSRRHEW